MRDHNYYVDLLTNRPSGTLYCGITNDLTRRISEHRAGLGGRFTRRYRCKTLVWFEHYTDVEQAILSEKRIKKWRRAWKIELIEAANPDWVDLAEGGPRFRRGDKERATQPQILPPVIPAKAVTDIASRHFNDVPQNNPPP